MLFSVEKGQSVHSKCTLYSPTDGTISLPSCDMSSIKIKCLGLFRGKFSFAIFNFKTFNSRGSNHDKSKAVKIGHTHHRTVEIATFTEVNFFEMKLKSWARDSHYRKRG